MATLTALLLAAGMSTFSGCGGITPPETPRTLAVADFPACVVKINGEQVTDEPLSFKAGETLDVEVELTLREGLEQSQLMPGVIHLMMASDDEDGEEMASVGLLDFVDVEDDAEDDAPNIVRMANEWTLQDVEPGTYELMVLTAIEPMRAGAGEEMQASPVFSTIVEVKE